jgi:hypothetical protein
VVQTVLQGVPDHRSEPETAEKRRVVR